MTRRFDKIDLSALPPPEVLQPLDFEAELAALVADYQDRYPDFTATLESEPVMALLQAVAYRVMIKTAAFNDAARGLLLAHATGGNLDNLAAHMGTARQMIDPGDPDAAPPVPARFESDSKLRLRAQLAWEALSTAGPAGAYVYHALSADPQVADVDAHSPTPGEVRVAVLSAEGDGTAGSGLLAAVAARVNAENVRPLTDQVRVVSAVILPYAVTARLRLAHGPGPDVVLAAAEARVRDHAARQRRLGRAVTRSALHAALHVEGVIEAILTEPADSLAPRHDQAAVLTGVTLTKAEA